jgi:hypothetical protein
VEVGAERALFLTVGTRLVGLLWSQDGAWSQRARRGGRPTGTATGTEV